MNIIALFPIKCLTGGQKQSKGTIKKKKGKKKMF
jgi:hypothetical protein